MKGRSFRFEIRSPGGRLDLTLVELLPDLSRTRLQQCIRDRFVSVNGLVVEKPGLRVQRGDIVEILVPPPVVTELVPEAIPLDVVFENSDLLVVNKPAGMVVHPSVGHIVGTLVHAALAHAPDITGVGGEVRPGIVHRLDKDTSGLILLAKHDLAHQALQRQFKAREVEKTYLALVDGRPPTSSGRVEAPIGRDPRYRKKMSVLAPGKGREAVTLFTSVQVFSEHALLEVHPVTGRTHQIRLHLAFLGCPVVGDRVYGRRKPSLPVSRQLLHAWRLRFVLPGESEPRQFEAPLPDDFGAALAALRRDG